jgi:hypothetical protein
MSAEKQLEDALVRIIGSLESQIFRCKKNADGEPFALFSEGKIAQKYSLTTKQIKGKSIRDVMGEEPFSRLKPYYDRAFLGETVEYRGVLFDNRYFSLRLAPSVRGNDGTVIEIVGITQDIDDIISEEIENEKITDLLNRIIENNPYSIQILNAKRRHIRENKAFLNLFSLLYS